MSEEKKQKEKNIASKNIPSKLIFILSLIIGIIFLSLIGFFGFYAKNQKDQITKKNIEHENFIPNIKPPTTPPPTDY